MREQPNILLIMADQLAPQFTGCYGHKVVKTPNLDALAARGMRFDSAYCNSPLCAPSRFSMMAGQLVSRIGAWDNASEFKASTPTFAHYLTTLGYDTCLSGKMHFVGPDQKHGFKDRITTDIYPSDFAWTPDWENHEERIDKWYHNMQTVKESGTAHASFQIDYDDEVAFAATRWLFNHARDKAAGHAKPFAMVASFIHPHDPYVARPEWYNLYQDDEIELPSYIPEMDEQDPFSVRLLEGIEATTKPLTDAEIIKARRAYFANVSYFDSKIGALVKTLEETGEIDNTIIIVTADHGDMLGERGLWYKMNFFENSARVPMVMAGPNIKKGAVPNACSLVDLLPTFIEFAGGSTDMVGEPIDGRSLVPLATGGDDEISEAIGEYCAEMTAAPVYMIRRDAFKYIHCDMDPPQLYNIEADPQERDNLATNPAYQAITDAFADEITSRWDGARMTHDVIAAQRSRRILHHAMEITAKELGPSQGWDYNPPSDAGKQYVRNHMDWTVAADRYRFPPEKRD